MQNNYLELMQNYTLMKLKSRESMTGRKSGWGLVNDNPNEVDLSEWGGVAPSCEIAPECPVCIK